MPVRVWSSLLLKNYHELSINFRDTNYSRNNFLGWSAENAAGKSWKKWDGTDDDWHDELKNL